MASRTAVLLDGGFVRKRFAELAKQRIAVGEVRPLADSLLDPLEEELFRIYFYDCAPSENTTTHPIVLCTGDRDFVPAMRLAQREGVQVVLATLGATVHAMLYEHADFVRPEMRAVL